MANEKGRRRRTGTIVTTPPAGPGAGVGSLPRPPGTSPGGSGGGRTGRLSPGAVLNNIYEVRSLITRGGMAEVYKGVSLVTEEDVAIKVILPHLANEPAVEAMFLREARMALRLSHPALASYRLAAREPTLDVLYLVTEFIDGVSLYDIPERPSPETVMALMRRLADGLRSAHDTGIIHRDLSPDNVLLPGARPERAKIIDFGIGKDLATSNQTVLGGVFAGKLGYATPEQFGDFGREIGPWTDVYSLGLLMLGLVTGHEVDMGSSVVEAIDRRRAGIDVSGAPEPLRQVLSAMLQADPKHRVRSMGEVLERLDEISQPRPEPEAPALEAERAPAPVEIAPETTDADVADTVETAVDEARVAEAAPAPTHEFAPAAPMTLFQPAPPAMEPPPAPVVDDEPGASAAAHAPTRGLDPARWNRIFPNAGTGAPPGDASVAPAPSQAEIPRGRGGGVPAPLIIGGGVALAAAAGVAVVVALALHNPHPPPHASSPANTAAASQRPVGQPSASAAPAPTVTPPSAAPAAPPTVAPPAIPFVRPHHRAPPPASNAAQSSTSPARTAEPTTTSRPEPAATPTPAQPPPAANPPPPKKGNSISRFLDRLFGGGHHEPSNAAGGQN